MFGQKKISVWWWWLLYLDFSGQLKTEAKLNKNQAKLEFDTEDQVLFSYNFDKPTFLPNGFSPEPVLKKFPVSQTLS